MFSFSLSILILFLRVTVWINDTLGSFHEVFIGDFFDLEVVVELLVPINGVLDSVKLQAVLPRELNNKVPVEILGVC